MTTTIPSGMRNRLLTILEPLPAVPPRTAMGAENIAWTAKATAYGMVETLSGGELEWARQIVATATHRITMPHYEAMTTKMRITWSTKTFEIGHIHDRHLDGVEDVVLVTSLD